MQKRLNCIGAIFLSLMLLALPVRALAEEQDSAGASNDTIVAVVPGANNTVYEYTSLEDAIDDAWEGDVITLIADYTLTRSTEIPVGVQVTIPSSSARNDTVTGNNAGGFVTDGSACVTLTVPANVTLTVSGTLLVAGNQQSALGDSGCLTGDFGKLDLAGNLVVNGTLYARGEISGAGTVIANSGSVVHELFRIHDWRGGNASLSAYNNGVFPFHLYEFHNIAATTVFQYGSSLLSQYYIYASDTAACGDITIIGENGLFEFDSTAAPGSGGVTFTTAAGGVTTAVVNGAVKTGDMVISVTQGLLSYNIDSASTVCPIGYQMNMAVANGGSLSVTNDLKLLPGCTFTVENGGALTVEENAGLYLYTAVSYKSTYNKLGWSSSANADLTINGALTNYGAIARTGSTFGTVVNVKEVTQRGTAVTVVNVPFYTVEIAAGGD